jgi:hypothetical protein
MGYNYYEVVTKTSINELQIEVKNKLRDGWQISGNFFALFTPRSQKLIEIHQGSDYLYFQPMVK